MQLTLHVPGSPANSCTHKNEYQAFLRRFSAKKTDSKFPDLAKRFKDKNGRGKLFQDWMDCEGNLTSLRILMVRTAKHQTRARRKMEGKTEKDCRAHKHRNTIYIYIYVHPPPPPRSCILIPLYTLLLLLLLLPGGGGGGGGRVMLLIPPSLTAPHTDQYYPPPPPPSAPPGRRRRRSKRRIEEEEQQQQK